jgi:hypothetical protein
VEQFHRNVSNWEAENVIRLLVIQRRVEKMSRKYLNGLWRSIELVVFVLYVLVRNSLRWAYTAVFEKPRVYRQMGPNHSEEVSDVSRVLPQNFWIK